MNTYPFEVTGSLAQVFGNSDDLYHGNLWHYLGVTHGAPNATKPYHNTRHTLHTTWLGWLACRYYLDRGLLTKQKFRNQLVSHVMHDYGNLGDGAIPDSENIKLAVAGLHEHAAPEDRTELYRIEPIIRASEYPHKDLGEDDRLEFQIMRDCDTAQALHPAWYAQICDGLARELKLNPFEMLEVQLTFLEKLHFVTEWGQLMFPQSAIDEKKAETKALLTGLSPQRAPKCPLARTE